MLRKLLFVLLTLIAIMAVLSCGGAKYDPTTPTTDGETIRWLGMTVAHPLPSAIAFTRDLADENSFYGINREIFVMNPAGNWQQRLTWDPAEDDYPAFAPNGHGIAFVSNRSSGGYGAHDIFRIGPFGDVLQLTDDTWQWDASATDWGPGYITAARLNTLVGAPFDVVSVYKTDPMGITEDYIATGHIASYYPAIGRTPNLLVFSARPAGPTYFDDMELYMLVDYQDEAIQLTYFGEEDEDPWNLIYTTNAQFNRQGTKIIFQTTHWGGTEIGMIDLYDGTDAYEPIRLTNNEFNDCEPCWDPSGNFFCWASDRDGNYELYKQHIYDPDSPSPVPPVIRLTNTEEDEHNPDWSPLLWMAKKKNSF